MKKILCLVLLFMFAIFTLTSCETETQEEEPTETPTQTVVPETYTVMWKNYNGEVLEVDENMEKGSMPSYDGAIPEKESDDKNDYIFVGWTPTISAVTSDISYVASFKAVEKSESVITYTVTWINENGDVLEVDQNVEAGTIPSYDGVKPEKESDGQYEYNFTGWTPELNAVTSDITYKAVFTATKIVKERVNVIVLAGQSNAVGQSFAYHLNDEDLEKYRQGFENVKIRYEINPYSETENLLIIQAT